MIHSGVINTIQLIHTTSGMYCCNAKVPAQPKTPIQFQYRKRQVLLQLVVVSVVNTVMSLLFQYRKRQVLLQLPKIPRACALVNKVSIPQAVGAVATTDKHLWLVGSDADSFNTASGRCCCNHLIYLYHILNIVRFQYRKRQVLLQQLDTYLTVS